MNSLRWDLEHSFDRLLEEAVPGLSATVNEAGARVDCAPSPACPASCGSPGARAGRW